LRGFSTLSVWWIRLGITHQRIQPVSPQQNGGLVAGTDCLVHHLDFAPVGFLEAGEKGRSGVRSFEREEWAAGPLAPQRMALAADEPPGQDTVARSSKIEEYAPQERVERASIQMARQFSTTLTRIHSGAAGGSTTP
jgi:hypothetical protein